MIVPRSGRFGVRVHLGGGRYEWRGTFPTREEAERAERGEAAPLSVSEWGKRWLSQYPRPAASTRQSYAYAVAQVCALVGDRPLESVRRSDVRALLGQLPASTVKVARAMWSDAVRDEACESNPWADLRLPQSRGRRDIQALSEREVDRLCAIAREVSNGYGAQMAALLRTLAYSGMRPGELMALRWEDVNGSLQVRRTRERRGAEKVPKNGRTRTVALASQVQRALEGTERNGSPYVFHGPGGKPLSRSALDRAWRRVHDRWLAEGGRPLTLHQLRHACATLLLERGLPAHVVAQQLGHSDGGRLVQTLYGHPDEARGRELVAEALS